MTTASKVIARTDTHTQTDTYKNRQTDTHTHRHTDTTKTLPLPHTREVINIAKKCKDLVSFTQVASVTTNVRNRHYFSQDLDYLFNNIHLWALADLEGACPAHAPLRIQILSFWHRKFFETEPPRESTPPYGKSWIHH